MIGFVIFRYDVAPLREECLCESRVQGQSQPPIPDRPFDSGSWILHFNFSIPLRSLSVWSVPWVLFFLAFHVYRA
jgi:hypothetical protein